MEIERITITRHGDDDYAVYFSTADFSVRGTYTDVMKAVYEYALADMLRHDRKEV